MTDAAEARILAQKGVTIVRIQQFYGKWAFWRFLGMQEPASVLFSLLNLRAHVKGLTHLQRRVPQSHPMQSYYVAWCLISINSWIWSAVFHTRGECIPCNSRGTAQISNANHPPNTHRQTDHREAGLFLGRSLHPVWPLYCSHPPFPPLPYAARQPRLHN